MADVVDLTGSDGQCNSEDEQLKKAIQLSLQQDEPCDQDLDSGDEQMKLAIRLSLEQPDTKPSLKRQASPDMFDLNKKAKLSHAEKTTNAEQVTFSGRPIFTKGTIKRTWASGFPKEQGDITIDEVLQGEMLDTAVLSSFQWDDAWLFSKVNCKRTRVTLIMDENDSNALRYHQKYKYISICGPKDIRGIMHSKLMLLFYKQYARIVIPTANLVPLDWGEAGHMENMVFLIDLPYHSDTVGGKALGRLTSLENLQSTVLDSIATAQGPHSDFYQGLHTFCACMNLKQTVLDKLSCCDFTATRGLAFVFGVGSFQRRELATRCSSYVGLEGLACQIKRLGLTCNGTVRVDYITSSLGKLRRDFLSSLYRACRGGCSPDDSSISSANRPKERGGCQRDGRSVAKGSCKEQLKDVEAQFQSHMKVYFPSHEVVERSLGGTRAAGTICLRSEHWNNPQFPKEHVYECKSVREGLIMHSKIIFVEAADNDKTRSPTSHGGWLYLGSANCTGSAWKGRNWECGVLVPKPQGDRITAFQDCMPVPVQLPARRLDAENKPWIFNG